MTSEFLNGLDKSIDMFLNHGIMFDAHIGDGEHNTLPIFLCKDING
jgi:hypothetical protein